MADAIAAEKSVEDSAIVALHNFAQFVLDNADDKARLVSMATEVQANTTALAAAIPQNTPVTPQEASATS